MSVMDLTNQHLGDAEIDQISQQIGADSSQTRSAIQTAMPMLLAGMAGNASQPDGATTIQQAIGTHAGVLDNLGSLLGAAGIGDAGGLLGRILGQHTTDVHEGVQQNTGLNSDQTRRLLMILAPMVLAMLAKRRQSSSQPVDTHLREEAQTARTSAETQSPQIGGILGKILNAAQAPPRQ